MDLAFPFGLSRAPNIFNRGADLLEWVFSDEDDIQHYYDDFLNVGPPGSDQCQLAQDTCLAVCDYLGVHVEHSKTISATTSLKYLSFILDSEQLEIRLPKEKQDKVLRALSAWSNKRAGSKRDLFSLIGLLQHCSQAIPLGRPFLRCLIDRAHSVEEFHHLIHLSIWEKDDIRWWFHLISAWNGTSLFLCPKWEIGLDCAVSSDAVSNCGFGAYFKNEWFADK